MPLTATGMKSRPASSTAVPWFAVSEGALVRAAGLVGNRGRRQRAVADRERGGRAQDRVPRRDARRDDGPRRGDEHASQIRGEEPTKEESFGNIRAGCIMDAGNNGVAILADKMLPPPKHGDDLGSAENHAAKTALERYFL
jgi:hypothetical protein